MHVSSNIAAKRVSLKGRTKERNPDSNGSINAQNLSSYSVGSYPPCTNALTSAATKVIDHVIKLTSLLFGTNPPKKRG